MENEILFIGLNDLDEYGQDIIKTITAKGVDKVKRNLPDLSNVSVHVKVHEKSDHVSRYTIIAKADSPNNKFDVEKDDHDLAKATHKALDALANEVVHYVNSK